MARHSLQTGQVHTSPAVADQEAAPVVPRLVGAVDELRAVGRTWCLAGVAGLAAAVLLGPPARLTALEAFGTALVFFLTLGGALGGMVLGRRSGPQTEYRRILAVAPTPPAGAGAEAGRRTAARGAIAALFTSVGMYVAAVVTLAAVLVFIGSPRDELLDRLPVAAGLVAAGWTLLCGLAALRVGAWFDYWERGHASRVLCPALTAGMMGHYYYAAEASAQRTGRGG